MLESPEYVESSIMSSDGSVYDHSVIISDIPMFTSSKRLPLPSASLIYGVSSRIKRLIQRFVAKD
eukprot:scaffold155990_cov47-Prasinocladus_malaysianus.AAC.1